MLKMRELQTARLVLREFQQADLTDVTSWEQGLEPQNFLEFCFGSYRKWGMGPWAMLLKERRRIVGSCSFCRISYDRALKTFDYCGEVNYFVAPQYRGSGLATEALRAILGFGFRDIRLTRIQGRCSPENLSSERVLQKAGLQFERMILASRGGSPDEKLYAIMREDYQILRTGVTGGVTE
jgi:ribosomal-protein-alanine N-acetyltransferase